MSTRFSPKAGLRKQNKMATIKNKRVMPPGGVWVYWDPDLEQNFEHYGLLEDFPQVVNKTRISNGLAPHDDAHMLHLIVEHICTAFPDFCEGNNGTKKTYRPLTSNNIANFTRTLVAVLKAKASGRDVYNPDPTAAAKVCAECPLNQKRLCTTCTGLEVVARRLLHTNQTTPLDRILGACSACGCMLRVKVHFSPEILREATKTQDRDLYPSDYPCWIWADSDKDS